LESKKAYANGEDNMIKLQLGIKTIIDYGNGEVQVFIDKYEKNIKKYRENKNKLYIDVL